MIVEPVPANNGLLLQRPEFLRHLRALTARAGALLIFDEVISGFRVARGGAAELYRHHARPRHLRQDPRRRHAGRRLRRPARDPAAPRARSATSTRRARSPAIRSPWRPASPRCASSSASNAWAKLEELGAQLERALAPVLAAAPWPAQLVRQGSLFWLSLQAGEAPRARRGHRPAPPPSATRRSSTASSRRGIALAPSAYEVGFLSLAHRDEHLDRLGAALGELFAGARGARLTDAAPSRSHARPAHRLPGDPGLLRRARWSGGCSTSAAWCGVESERLARAARRQPAGRRVAAQAEGLGRDEVASTLPRPRLQRPRRSPSRRARYDAVEREHVRRLRQYAWEGGFFLAVLGACMAVISRTLRAEAQLRRRQQNFIAAVTHELKSPIASLQLAAETIALRRPEPARLDALIDPHARRHPPPRGHGRPHPRHRDARGRPRRRCAAERLPLDAAGRGGRRGVHRARRRVRRAPHPRGARRAA